LNTFCICIHLKRFVFFIDFHVLALMRSSHAPHDVRLEKSVPTSPISSFRHLAFVVRLNSPAPPPPPPVITVRETQQQKTDTWCCLAWTVPALLTLFLWSHARSALAEKWGLTSPIWEFIFLVLRAWLVNIAFSLVIIKGNFAVVRLHKRLRLRLSYYPGTNLN
jgi:hypothetical protein